MTVSTYKIKKNEALKKIEIYVGEKITLAEVERFTTEFQRTVSSIDATSFDLEIDCTNMKVLTPDLTVNLTEAMGLYKQVGFKKNIFVVQNDVVLKMQLTRLARNAGLTNAEVISK